MNMRVLVGAFFTLTICFAQSSVAQLNRVPVANPHPFYPPEVQNVMEHANDDNQSVGSFIGSLQGQDSIIEVILGRGRLITLEEPLSLPVQNESPLIAVGDPSILDVEILPNRRMIRLRGKRAGVTDLSIVTSDGELINFQVQMAYDLNVVRALFRQMFPDAKLTVVQLGDHLVVEGQADNAQEAHSILQMLNAYAYSVQIPEQVRVTTSSSGRPDPQFPLVNAFHQATEDQAGERKEVGSEIAPRQKPHTGMNLPASQVINLIRLSGAEQGARLNQHQVSRLPDSEVKDLTHHDLNRLRRIEAQLSSHNSTATGWGDPLSIENQIKAEARMVHGPYGFSR